MATSTPLATSPSQLVPLPGQSAVDVGLVAETLTEINTAYEAGALTTGRGIARIVLDKMFRDDVGRFLADAESHASYQALADQPDLRIGKGALWYAVAIEQNFAVLGDLAPGLTVSHHRRLVHVQDVETRKALAGKVLADGLTVEELEGEIAGLAPPRPSDAPPLGRPRLPEPVKRYTRVQHAIAHLDPDLDGIAEEDLEALLARAEAGQAELGRWIEGVRRRLGR